MHDTILFYGKEIGKKRTFHRFYEEASESYLKRFGGKTQVLDESGTRKITLEEETKGMPIRDVWDISIIAGFKGERMDYPTQKPEELIERIITSCSNESDIVMDSFIGSGTTAAIAQKLGRRWIGCDINKGAIQTTAKRLQTVMREQAELAEKAKQRELVTDEEAKPQQLAFNTWRVNDYDLHIQHNEAVELACEHIGITRTRSDSYFDGRLGNRLVKIIPFNHPLSPLDLGDIEKELQRRPEEQRDVTVVCLGMELTARAWAEQHNRNRPINKFHIIELRTDRKYGGFIKHEPLSAVIDVQRKGEQLIVEITDVFSPTIMQRLNLEEGLFRAHIEDWRAVVDCVLIDAAYNGEVFNVVASDVPAKKQDMVTGRYELPAPPPGSTVAVKVIDMLGEEVVVTREV
jgi:adenine-specific DNA-methyltransferase